MEEKNPLQAEMEKMRKELEVLRSEMNKEKGDGRGEINSRFQKGSMKYAKVQGSLGL